MSIKETILNDYKNSLERLRVLRIKRLEEYNNDKTFENQMEIKTLDNEIDYTETQIKRLEMEVC